MKKCSTNRHVQTSLKKMVWKTTSVVKDSQLRFTGLASFRMAAVYTTVGAHSLLSLFQ